MPSEDTPDGNEAMAAITGDEPIPSGFALEMDDGYVDAMSHQLATHIPGINHITSHHLILASHHIMSLIWCTEPVTKCVWAKPWAVRMAGLNLIAKIVAAWPQDKVITITHTTGHNSHCSSDKQWAQCGE